MPKISHWLIFVPLRYESVRSERESGADRCLLCLCVDLTLQFWSVTVPNTLKRKVIKELLVFHLFIRCRSGGQCVDGTTVLKWLWQKCNSTMGTRFVCSLKVFRRMVYSHVTSFGHVRRPGLKNSGHFGRWICPLRVERRNARTYSGEPAGKSHSHCLGSDGRCSSHRRDMNLEPRQPKWSLHSFNNWLAVSLVTDNEGSISHHASKMA